MNRYIKKIIIFLLKLVSQLILWRHKPVVIAITGSVGKTTTKDVVAHGMASVAKIAKADKSYNSDFGVPLSIIMAPNAWGSVLGWFNVIAKGIRVLIKDEYPKVLILEVGTRFPGDIPRLAKWLKPHISIITHIPDVPVHIEFFGTRENIVDEKSALVKYTRAGGSVILNKDSKHVYDIAQNTNHPVVTIGFDPTSDVTANNLERVIAENGVYGMKFNIIMRGKVIPTFAPGFIARHQIYGVMFAVAAGDALGYDAEQIAMSMSTLGITPGRLNPILGINNTLILDDSYNASPAAMEAAIETLTTIDTNGRHIAVLGDMLDLGKMTKDAHEEIGYFLKDQKLDFIYLVGPRMQYAYDLLIDKKYAKTKIMHSDSMEIVQLDLLNKIKFGDVILVKGSQGMRMEKLVEELIEDKNSIPNLLVRQDSEWKKRI